MATTVESEHVTDAAPARAGEREDLARPSGLRGALRYCLGVFVAVRAGLTVVAVASTALIPSNVAAEVPGWMGKAASPGWHNVFTAWERWDSLWLLRIADAGYSVNDYSAAFFPVYPLFVRVVSWIIGDHPFAAGLIVSNLAALAALVAVYLITEEEFSTRWARRTVLYLSLFPTAYFFIAPYSESLFLLFATVCLWSARHGHWGVAAISGALATGTRSIGLVLILALLVEAVRQARTKPAVEVEQAALPANATAVPDPGDDALAPGSDQDAATSTGERGWIRRLAWPLVCTGSVGLGTLAYLYFWFRTEGDWLQPLHQQGAWEREGSLPWVTLASGTREGFAYIGSYPGGYHLLDWILVAVALAAAVWVALRAPASYALYTWASLLVPLSFVYGARPFMSVPRFVLPMFPLFWALCAAADRWKAHTAIVAASAAGLGVMTLLFVTWYWVF